MNGEEFLEESKRYFQIKRRIVDRIGKQWPAGSRLPPIKELARDLGVGQSNTHRAVQELVREGTLVSRPSRGTFVRPTIGAEAQAVSTSSPMPLARDERYHLLRDRAVHILCSHPNPSGFLRAAIDGLDSVLREVCGKVVHATLPPDPALLPVRHARADALAVINPDTSYDICLAPRQVAVELSTATETATRAEGRYDIVSVSSELGGYLAGRLLRQAGCRDACFIGCARLDDPDAYDRTSLTRLDGFIKGFGRAIRPEARLRASAYMSACGAQAINEYLKLDPRPDAVFAASDELAVGFAHGGWVHQLMPARDYHLVGFDGQDMGRDMPYGPLTTIQSPMAQMGEMAAKLLLERMIEPDRAFRRVELGPSVVAGKTVQARQPREADAPVK